MRIAVIPILLAVVLCLPCLGLGYFWDDFVFLTRVQSDPIAALGPEPGSFYRPLPRAVYFWPLAPLGSSGAVVAHAANLALFALSIALLVSLVRNLAGARAGVFAGIAFAALAPTPSLVAWASGSQDLLAIALTLAALQLRNSGRNFFAGIAWAGALLSKETAAVALPALIFWDSIVGRRPFRIYARALGYGGLALGWVLLHPGIPDLAARGFASEPKGYVGFANMAVSEFHGKRYLLALFNVPAAQGAAVWPAWPKEGTAIGIGAMVLAVAGALSTWRLGTVPTIRLSIPRAMLLALLISLPAIVLPALLIQRWAAYFVCLPAIGSSLLIGVLLSRGPPVIGALVLAGYVGLGWACRGVEVSGADTLNEKRFVAASAAIRQVERSFRKLHPTLPAESQVLLSVASSGVLGIHGTMHDGQALRIWYRDPTISTLRPERREPVPRAEFLFRITSSRDVVEIDADRGLARSSGAEPDAEEVRAVTRTYARGLAASGEGERAVRILNRLAAQDLDSMRSYDERVSAMVFLAAGDRARADRALALAPPISREFALYGVGKVLAEPTGLARLDSCAFAAFGISSSDPVVLRSLMETFYASEFVPQAIGLARRLQAVAPGDSESAAILKELDR